MTAGLAGIAGLAASTGCAPRRAPAPLAPSAQWAPLPVRHVDVDGIDVAYVDSGPVAGDSGPPVVLVHGLSSWIGFWEHQIGHLAARRRVLALDLPGYGASGRPDPAGHPEMYGPPWFAGVIEGWLDRLGIGRAVLVGHSMGGQVALSLALDRPERVAALILSAPAGIERFAPGEAAWLAGWTSERRAYDATEQEIRRSFELAFSRRDAGYERLLSERVQMRGTPALMGTSIAVARSISGMLEHPVRDRLAAISMPTLVLFGTADRMIPNPVLHGGRSSAIGRAAAREIPGARLALIPGAGHTLHHDAPEAFNREVDAFLAEVLR